LEKVYLFFYLGEFKKDIIIVDKILKINPKQADALNLMGASLMNISTSNGYEALKFFNKSLKIEPMHYFAGPNREDTLVELGLKKSSRYTW